MKTKKNVKTKSRNAGTLSLAEAFSRAFDPAVGRNVSKVLTPLNDWFDTLPIDVSCVLMTTWRPMHAELARILIAYFTAECAAKHDGDKTEPAAPSKRARTNEEAA